jgi:hypothetical protein
VEAVTGVQTCALPISTTWTWGSGGWAQVPIAQAPLLPLTRSSALAPPMAFDEARGVMVIFVSAN